MCYKISREIHVFYHTIQTDVCLKEMLELYYLFSSIIYISVPLYYSPPAFLLLVQCHLYVLRFAKQKASLYVISCKILLFFQITFIFSIPHIAELSRTELSAWISQLLLLLLVYDYMYAVVMVITFLKLRFRRE